MKSILIATAALIAFSACDTTGQLTPAGQQGINNALGIATLALQTYVGVETAKSSGGKVSAATVATLAQNDLNGIGQLMQSNVGKTPSQANIASGASSAIVGSAIQAALPQTPISQSTVNTVYAAAAKVPTITGATPPGARMGPTLYFAGRAIQAEHVVTQIDQ